MAINAVNGIGWEGWVPQNPRVNTILTPDNLSTITTAGWLSETDPLVFPQKIYTTDLWDIEYDYNADTGTQTYGRFVTTIDINGVVTLYQDISGGNVILPVVSGNLAIFSGTTGAIADSGASLTNPALANVASVHAGPYTVNNILVADDTVGTIRSGVGVAATQINTPVTATPSFPGDVPFRSGLTLSAATLTSGATSGGDSFATFNANSGATIAGHSSSITLSGALGATSISSGVSSTVNASGNVMTSGAILAGYTAIMNAPVNVTGDTSNFCVLYGQGPATGSLGSVISFSGKASNLLSCDSTSPMVGTPSGLTPSGSIASLFIEISGVTYQIPCSTILS